MWLALELKVTWSQRENEWRVCDQSWEWMKNEWMMKWSTNHGSKIHEPLIERKKRMTDQSKINEQSIFWILLHSVVRTSNCFECVCSWVAIAQVNRELDVSKYSTYNVCSLELSRCSHMKLPVIGLCELVCIHLCWLVTSMFQLLGQLIHSFEFHECNCGSSYQLVAAQQLKVK